MSDIVVFGSFVVDLMARSAHIPVPGETAKILLAQLEVNQDANELVVDYAKGQGARVVLNPAPIHAVSSEFLCKADVITPNEVEASALSGIPIKTPDDALRAAGILMDKGVKSVVITLGKQGVLAVTEAQASSRFFPSGWAPRPLCPPAGKSTLFWKPIPALRISQRFHIYETASQGGVIMKLNQYIDHTILKPAATAADVEAICREAVEYEFASVCVNTCHVRLVSRLLSGSPVKTCVVVGFPLGAMATEAKAFEAKHAVSNGAQEVDMVLNVGALKERNDSLVEQDIRAVKEACGSALLKVILETCLLSDEEKERACRLAVKAGADFVKTSTGFSTGGATAHDVALMRKTVGPNVGVKASGGIRTREDALSMIEAGASRIGASASVQIVSE